MRGLALALGLFTVSCGALPAARDTRVPRPTTRLDELRPDTPGTTEAPPVFDATETVLRYAVPDAAVVVHYSPQGRNAVPTADADDSGVPDFVETVGDTYRSVLTQYHGPWGFRAPPDDSQVPVDNGGDARFDAYLVDFALRADGAYRRECLSATGGCPGYMTQENDFTGYGYASKTIGTRVVSSHEYFHAVQTGYDPNMSAVLSEGSAVWATERFDPTLTDFEGFTPSYLAKPERSLDQEPTGPVEGYIYGSALFFECLTDHRGPDTLRDLFERLHGQPWLPELDATLQADGGAPLATEFERCANFNLFTGARTRPGYGHRRAAQLGTAPVTEGLTSFAVPKARMFRASSRYYRVSALEAGSAVWWQPIEDAPDAGAGWLRVRTAPDVSGQAPTFTPVPMSSVTDLSGTSNFIAVSHVMAGVQSVPIALCVGSHAFVDQCRAAALDAGAADAGFTADAGPSSDAGVADAGAVTLPVDTSEWRAPMGCQTAPWSVGAWLVGALWRARRRR